MERLIQEKILNSDMFKDFKTKCDLDNDKVSLHIRNGDFLLESKHHFHDCFNRLEYLKDAINYSGL